MNRYRLKSGLAGHLRPILLTLAIGCLTHCGTNADSLTGGASEVGNPNAVIFESGKNDTTSRDVKGVEIDFQNATIRLKREAQQTAPDSSNARVDSVSFSTVDNHTER